MRRKKTSIKFHLKNLLLFIIFLLSLIVMAFMMFLSSLIVIRSYKKLNTSTHSYKNSTLASPRHLPATLSTDPTTTDTTTDPPKPEKNYFRDAMYYKNLPNILNTSACRIPDFSKDFENYYKMNQLTRPTFPQNCTTVSKRWTYVNGTTIVLDEKALKDSGYSPLFVNCCYSEIRRVNQSPAKYDSSADTLTNRSQNCLHLHSGGNNVTEEFIRVQCSSSGNNSGKSEEIVYTNYHALVNENKTSAIKYKIQTWQNWTKQLPPNVIILGIDSLSRSNFQRSMPKTAQVLKELGAVDMLGFIKVGDNTFPNLVPALTGITIDDLPHVCANYHREGQDNCSYIWKDFSSLNYLTAHIEDAPSMQIFNYAKIGFVQQQVDFYLRPFMIASDEKQWKSSCIGPDKAHNKVLNYFRRLMQMASEQHVPLFSLTWLSSLAHEDMNAVASADEDFQTFLRSVDLENTILFFMGDHGARFGPFRQTHHGWYEEKLPNFWLYLPPIIRKQKPEWMHNLQLNSERIFTPFDIHQTLRHILKDVFNYEKEPNFAFDYVGQSLFERIPVTRTCKDAHIEDAYCPCFPPHQIPVDSDEAKLAANSAVVQLNSQLTSRCAPLSIQQVIAAAVTSNSLNFSNTTKQRDSTVYIVAFTLHPGGVLVESTVRYSSHSKLFQPSKRFSVLDRVGEGGRKCVDDSLLVKVCQCV